MSFDAQNIAAPARAHPPAVPRRLVFAPAAFAAVVTAMRAALPAEGVGLLGGHRRGDTLSVSAFAPLANRAGAPDRFAVDPVQFARAAAALAARAAALLGFVHSHPGGVPAPSATDAQSLWRDCVQVIVVPARRAVVRAFWADAAGFSPLRLGRSRA